MVYTNSYIHGRVSGYRTPKKLINIMMTMKSPGIWSDVDEL